MKSNSGFRVNAVIDVRGCTPAGGKILPNSTLSHSCAAEFPQSCTINRPAKFTVLYSGPYLKRYEAGAGY
jgi:hypothetical protein